MTIVVALGDMHCGSYVGLTPPDWWRDDLEPAQKELWEVAKMVRKLRPSIIICNGDAIHGKNDKSGGRQLLTADREEQAEIAEECLRFMGGDKCKYVLTAGTGYHVGDGEDWESVLAHRLHASFGGHEYLCISGVSFDVKHHLGSSGIPHGRHTAIARDHLWSELWSAHSGHPSSQVMLRSHVHYHSFCGGPGWLAMTLPAMCGLGDMYGTRRCSGIVDVGFASFNCNKGEYSWSVESVRLHKAKPAVRRL